MPTLPTYNSQRNIQAQTPLPLRNEVQAKYQAGQMIAKTVETVGDKWVEAQNTIDYTQAKSVMANGLNEIQSQSEADSDYANSEKRKQDIDKLKQTALKGIRSPGLRNRIYGEIDNDAYIGKVKVDNIYKKKEILINEIKLDNTIAALIQQKSNAGTEVESNKINQDITNLIQANVATGVITPAKGARLLDDVRLGEIDLDIMKDESVNSKESFVVNELKKGDKGIYKNLTEKERADRLEKAELHIGRNKRLFEFAQEQDQNQNEAGMLIKQIDGTLTIKEVKDNLLSLGIRKSFGEKILKNLYADATAKTDYAVYNQVKEMQLSNASPAQINQFILDNSDNLSSADKKYLINQTYANADKKQNTIIRYNSNALKNWALKVSDGNTGLANDLTYEFYKRVTESNATDAQIDNIAQELQKEKIKELYPSTALTNDVPNFVADRKKLKKLYSKESKLTGKSASIKPMNAVLGTTSVNFDDL